MPRRIGSAAALVTSIFCLVIGTNIVNVALPAIGRIYSAGSSDVVWLINGFQIALVTSLLGFAAVGQKIGYRAVFRIGVGLFTLGAGVCALSPSLNWMIGARVLQGFGAAATFSVVGAMVRDVYPRSWTGTAVAMTSAVVALSAGLSPIVGSAILTYASWRWLFLGIVPLGVATLALSLFLPANRTSQRPADWPGCLLGGAALGFFVLGVNEVGGRNALAAAYATGAAIMLVLFVWHSRRIRHPILPVDLLRGPRIAYAATASVLCFAGNMIILTALPFFLIVDLSRPQMEVGLLMSLWPFTIVGSAILAGALAIRIREEVLCLSGSGVMALGIGCLCWGTLIGELLPAIAGVAVTAFGFGLFQGPNNRVLLLTGPIDRSGGAAIIQSTARELGNATGAAIVAAIFATGAAQTSFLAFLAAAVLAILTGLANLRRLV